MELTSKSSSGKDLSVISAYDYFLPPELIAQDPLVPRDASRLMLIKGDNIQDKNFYDLPQILKEGDLLVLNDTRVRPCRIMARKKTGGSIEIFLLKPTGKNDNSWLALIGRAKKIKAGDEIFLPDLPYLKNLENFKITIGEKLNDGIREVIFSDTPDTVIASYGKIPLPPYITKSSADDEQYQTIYAKKEKETSCAAPTAGLHFTDDLFARLEAKGIKKAFITLDVGLGTFRPVKADNIANHVMHEETCSICEETARLIREAKARKNRVIAVGTTVMRTLESFAHDKYLIKSGTLDTKLFIMPGFDFKIADAMITNFHLPKSTLLMLTAAFGGYDLIMCAYEEAVKRKYRFFSFGDAMIIFK